MKRAIPVLVLTAVGLVPLWRYAPSTDTTSTEAVAPAPSASSASSSTSSSGSSALVIEGSVVNTEKGAVQVEVTFDGDRIASVRMLQQPVHPQTTAAVPKLIEATLEAQSADIDTVSGATITSEGYKESLQAALDEQDASASASSSPTEAASEVVAGSTVNTEKGAVQVEVTFEGDTIASVRMLRQPGHPQTTAAVPKLIEATLEAQSADIDTVSGATITSDGYKESLQAALDAKGA
ncbi:FMN-binding protein [Streptomyces sp. P17]|uniref:FMN-binding protein n=1 Tax=Streptomyces sp. P17 TaxID=3074716 RepID=UPI0028F44477|nr:FMN-binding protein [Streptomyces sp. P17]MDT9695066.1 FMN-binding protein [Streptomyces sp. P17]